MRGAVLALAVLPAGCAVQGSGMPPEDAGPPACALSLAAPAAEPLAGQPLRLEAEVDASGFRTHSWEVRFEEEDAPLELEPGAADGSAVRFTPARAGYYRVRVEGAVDGAACAPDETAMNVLAPGAVWERYVLRATPPSSHPAPLQAVERDVPGGGNYLVGIHVLERGTAVHGSLLGPEGAQLSRAYLRATRVAGGPRLEIEGHSDASGTFDMRLPEGSWELLVVPEEPGLAPWRRAASPAGEIPNLLELPAAAAVTGTVLGPGGAPVEGARVALWIDGIPSTLGVTDAGGEVTLAARTGATFSLAVTPPEGAGLPRLELEEAPVEVVGGSDFAVHYHAGLETRTESFTVVGFDGSTPVGGGARAIFLAEIGPAGAVTVDGGAAREAAGSVRAVATTGGGGELGPISLPAAAYEVALEDAAGQAALVGLDLSPGKSAPSNLALKEPATLRGRIVNAEGEAVAGARVSASPVGPLARAGGAAASAATGQDGRFELAAAAGGSYALEVDPRSGPTLRLEASAPAPGGELDLGDRSLPPAVRLLGTLEISGVAGGAEGVHLAARCPDCALERPLAEIVTGPGGRFELVLPDPGLSR